MGKKDSKEVKERSRAEPETEYKLVEEVVKTETDTCSEVTKPVEIETGCNKESKKETEECQGLNKSEKIEKGTEILNQADKQETKTEQEDHMMKESGKQDTEASITKLEDADKLGTEYKELESIGNSERETECKESKEVKGTTETVFSSSQVVVLEESALSAVEAAADAVIGERCIDDHHS